MGVGTMALPNFAGFWFGFRELEFRGLGVRLQESGAVAFTDLKDARFRPLIT